VVHQGETSYTVRITDASKPTWLVVGQSHNAGWHATLDGHDLGPSRLVDGYANGWRIDPKGRTGPLLVKVEWTPQNQMRIAFVLSLLGLLACFAIVIGSWVRVGRRRRSDRAAASAAAVADGAGPDAADALDTRELVGVGEIGQRALVNPFRTGGHRPSIPAVALTAIGAGIAAGVLSRPWTTIPVALLTAAALVSPRWRGILRVVPPVIVVVILAWVTSGQMRHSYPASFDWPIFFERLRTSAWLVVVLLAVDGIVGLVRDDRGTDASTPDDAPVPPTRAIPEVDPAAEEPRPPVDVVTSA
jgi:hypothetical protein